MGKIAKFMPPSPCLCSAIAITIFTPANDYRTLLGQENRGF
jgi:hypothetical protein